VTKRLSLALVALAIAGCESRDTVAVALCSAGSECESRDAFCAGEAPVLTDDGPRCTSDIAAEAFSAALCACRDVAGAQDLAVDSFDSREGPYPGPGAGGGTVGVVGKIEANGVYSIGGDLVVSDVEGMRSGVSLRVGGDLACAGELDGSLGDVEVGGNAAVGGDVRAVNLSVGGTLTVPADAAIDVTGTESVSAVARDAVAVAPPCGCDVGDLIDVPAIVDLHATANDNAAAGFEPGLLEDTGDDPRSFELPCGRFFVERLQGGGDVRLEVNGRTALFIAGNVNLDADFDIDVGPAGELDLFIAGNINIGGAIDVGDPARPSALRIYTGGAGAVNASALVTLAANLYAPVADFVLSSGGEVFGAAFVNTLLASQPVEFHYDRSVADAATCAR